MSRTTFQGREARTGDASGVDAAPRGTRVQLKRDLAGLTYHEQVERVRPPVPVAGRVGADVVQRQEETSACPVVAPADTDVSAAAAANEALGFGPSSSARLRESLGLDASEELDECFSAALASHQAQQGLEPTGVVDQTTMFTLPIPLLDHEDPSEAAEWYSGNGARYYRPGEHEERVTAVCAALGVEPSSVSWSDDGLIVTESFVRRAVQWQVWQRLGLAPDGRLGTSALVRMGVDPAGTGYAVWNASDLRPREPNLRLLELLAEDTFLTNCLRVLTEEGVAKRLGDITGDDGLAVGITHLTSPSSVEALIRRMYEAAPGAFIANFFGDEYAGASDEELAQLFEDLLSELDLNNNEDENDNEVLAAIADSLHYEAFVRLFQLRQFQEVQIEHFRERGLRRGERRADDVAEAAGEEVPEVGTVALSVCVGNSRTQAFRDLDAFSGSEEEFQLEIGRRYAQERLDHDDDPAVAVAYWEMLFDHYVHGGDRQSWSETSEAARDGAAEWDVSRNPTNRVDRLHRVLERFSEVWTEPYSGPDMQVE